MNAFTKGVWVAKREELHFGSLSYVYSGDTLIASIGGSGLNEVEGNVHLIASAPKLLDALECIMWDWSQGWKYHETASYQMALDAIKKARGE